MPDPLTRLPNLSLIHTFVVVGRKLSITRAGQELHLTQSAVSRQIRQLEEQLGVSLFERGFRSITLTQPGLQLFHLAAPWLEQLAELAESMRCETTRRPVTITASMGVAALWLLPRLGEFQQTFPHIDVRVAANNRMVNLEREDIDLAIRYGSRQSVPEDAVRLFGEGLVPVAHPALQAGLLEGAADIARSVLVDYDDPDRPWLQWDSWLAARGWTDAVPRSRLRFNQYDQAIHAALAGHGIALGRLPLVAPMLADGRLLALAQVDVEASPFSYWLIRHPGAQGSAADDLANWIEGQAAIDAKQRQHSRHASPG